MTENGERSARLSLELEQEKKGATEGLFEQTEKLISLSPPTKEAVEYIGRSNPVFERYHTIVDFLFCEIYNQRQACFDYYSGKGAGLVHRLQELMGVDDAEWQKTVQSTDQLLGQVAMLARKWRTAKKPADWNQFLKTILQSVPDAK